MFDGFFNYISNQSNQGQLALFAIIASWLIYRLGVWTERNRVLLSLSKELELHAAWLNSSYEDGKVADPGWNEKSYIVFKLSTVATDHAITVGPNLFLNKNLIESMVGYRQRVSQFNQLIEAAMIYQANYDLWTRGSEDVDLHMMNLTGQIHWYGIGTNNSNRQFGHYYYLKVKHELQQEQSSIFLPILWFLTNLNLFRVKRWLCKYL